MEEKITNANDYVNWLRWVSNAKQNRHVMYECTHYATIPVLLQVHQVEGGNLDNNSIKQLASSNHDELSTRWREICQRIRVDISLDKEKQQL
jgi:hypothetical protein